MSLLRELSDLLRPGDVLLTDRLMANRTGIWMLKQRGVETVSRLNKANRRADFRRGIRLGKDDHLVRWTKPTSIRSVDRLTYHSLPESFTVREVRFRVEQPGFWTRSVIVVTTLLDPEETTKEELAELYRARWHNEVCQADCVSRYTLYQSRGSAHSKCYSVVGAGTMEPDTPAIEPRRTAMRRLNERLGPPQPKRSGSPCPPERTLEGTARPYSAGSAHDPHAAGGPAPAASSGRAGGAT